MQTPLLSIIIPTKNRQYTCLFAVQSALLPGRDDIEIIVQDCSEKDTLKKQLEEKFGNDPRIRYFYTDQKPSMTDNWNIAYANAKGTYMCAIGDDDGVLPNVYDMAKWGLDNNIPAITHSNAFTYNWPDYASKTLKGVVIQLKSPKIGIRKVKHDRIMFKKYATLESPMKYGEFPMAYHNLTHRDLYERIVKNTGKFLHGTSMDVYSVFSYFKYLQGKDYGYAEQQFTIRGASGSSNSSRFVNGKIAEHFAEFKNDSWPDKYLPRAHNLYTTVAESMISACTITGQEDLIEEINFPLLYARIAANTPSVKVDLFNNYLSSEKDKLAFEKHLRELSAFNMKTFIAKIATMLPVPVKWKYRLYEAGAKQKVYGGVRDIVACIKMISNP